MTTNGDWMDTAIRVVDQALRAAPNARQAAYRVAEVTPDSDAGWFVVRKRAGQYWIDAIGQGRLQAAGGAENPGYDILEVAVDGEIVRVRSAAPQVTGLALYAPKT